MSEAGPPSNPQQQQHAAAASTADILRAVQNNVGTANNSDGTGGVPANPKMRLTPTEFARAIHLKQLIAATGHIKPMMDFDIVQFAIGTYNEDLEKVVARIFITQCFQEEYNIQETVEDGIQLLYQFIMTQQPGFILDIEYLPDKKNFFAVADLSAFDPAKIKTKHDTKVFCGGTYYSYHCQFPDFECMRIGRSCVIECMNASLQKNFSASFVRKHANEVLKAYPNRVKESHFTNSPDVATLMWQIWKNVLPKDVQKTMHFGNAIPGYEGQNLADLYQMPSVQVARQKLIAKCFQFLVDRYTNRASFTLHNATIMMEDQQSTTTQQEDASSSNQEEVNDDTTNGEKDKK